MRVGVFLFGAVEMDDAGAGPPAPTDRRYSNEARCGGPPSSCSTSGCCATSLGYDSYWLTEHHFQYEGYEVVPNGLLFSAILAERTERIRIGTMFNIVGQWHPLKLAEDFATVHNISGGRGILGVGRGTVPREAQDARHRHRLLRQPRSGRGRRPQPQAVRRGHGRHPCWPSTEEEFSFQGEVFQFPPPGIPDRGGFVEKLTLVPRPLHPFETWQAITSPPTLDYVPDQGLGWGVLAQAPRVHPPVLEQSFAERYAEVHGIELAPGEKRLLVVNPWIADSKEQAMAEVRDGHDEYWKFLGPYGWSRGYMGDDGKPSPPGLIPTLEQSIANRTWLVGTGDDVAEQIADYAERLGGVENLVIFPNMPGDPYARTTEQLHRFAEEVLPKLS